MYDKYVLNKYDMLMELIDDSKMYNLISIKYNNNPLNIFIIIILDGDNRNDEIKYCMDIYEVNNHRVKIIGVDEI